VLRSVQVTKNVRDAARLIRSNLTRVALVEAFQTPVPECPDHQDTVSCIGTDIKYYLNPADLRKSPPTTPTALCSTST